MSTELNSYSFLENYNLSEIDTLIDIGVSDGEFVYNTANFLPQVTRRYGFDPIAYEEFERWDQLQFIPKAVGLHCGEVEFFQSPIARDSSLLSTNGKKISVQQIRMDCFIEETDLKNNKFFVKIDTQGTDLECLLSFGRYLDNVVAIHIEAWLRPFGDSLRYFSDTIRDLDLMGFYTVEIINPVFMPKSKMTGQYDLVCFNKNDDEFYRSGWN